MSADFINVAAYLPAMAESRPNDPAIIIPARKGAASRAPRATMTFLELNQECDRLAQGLERAGVRRGVRTVLMVTPSLEFFALTFALFKIGAVIVMVDPGIGIKNLNACLAEAEPEAFIGIPKAHVARVLFGWARGSLKTFVTVGRKLFWSGTTLAALREKEWRGYPMADAEPDETAAILFTSGSTGPPKGAVYTHGVFSSQVRMLRETFGIQPGEIDLPTFPLFALFDSALGMTAVIPDMDFTRPGSVDPENIIQPILDHGATNMFGSPALIDRVSRYGAERGIKLPTLRRALSAGAPVSPAILERFRTMLPESCDVYTPYGATEALPVAAIESREALAVRSRTDAGEGICVGRPVKEIDVFIIKISDAPIERWDESLLAAPGEVGEIVVKGPVVTREYFHRPEQTALAKMLWPDGMTIVHRMGDLGRFDEEGRLWYCGRKSQRVTTAEGPLFTDPIEGIFNAHPLVRRTALVGVGARGAQTPALCVELSPEASGADRAALVAELKGLATKSPEASLVERFLFHDNPFPVDIRHNAKIGREKLAVWAAGELKKGASR